MNLSKHIQNAKKKPALMTHAVAGFPNKEKAEQIIMMMDSAGADVIEIQIPFSDPVADGPTMMECNERSIQQGFRVKDAFDTARKISKKISAPLLFMTYFNIVYKKGIQTFCQEAKESGMSGIIIPDMPIEEEQHEGLIKECIKQDLAWIPVVSPITPKERIQEIARYANGFWYVVSRTGVTGIRNEFSQSAKEQIDSIRKYSPLPTALAFGVSNSEHIQKIKKYADMAVIGSAVQDIFLQKEKKFPHNLEQAKTFLKSLR
jgi:tryptophan synthase alpha subunit